MKFFGVHIEDLESERFLSASNDQIATWLFLHKLCSKQMNGGTIAEATDLPDRFWMHHGLSSAILTQPSPLWAWDGDSLTVEPYDIKGEKVCRSKSAGGKKGMETRWKGKANKTLNNTLNIPNPTQPNPTQPKKKRSVSTFEKPTLEMVNEYGATLNPPFTSAADFLDYYDGNGWKVGTSPMKDWRATLRRWNRKQTPKPKTRELTANDCSI
jgi:hypothetical protein